MSGEARQQAIEEHKLDALNVRTVGGLTTVVVGRDGNRGEAQSYDGEASTIAKAIENLGTAESEGKAKAEAEAAEVDGPDEGVKSEDGPATADATGSEPVAPAGADANAKGTEVKEATATDKGSATPGSDATSTSATGAGSTATSGAPSTPSGSAPSGGRSGGR